MNAADLETLARDAHWCSGFGAGSVEGAVCIASREEWRALIRGCMAAEFLNEPAPGLPDFAWLGEGIDTDLPRAASRGAIGRAAHESLRGVTSEWLVCDNSDLNGAFRQAALHVFMTAAAEVETGSPGLWLRAAQLYAVGRWPFGITEAGEVLVL